MDESKHEDIADAVRSRHVTRRFLARLLVCPESDCVWWTGAISARGHGRFWLSDNRVIIAHRFAWAIAYGAKSLQDTPVLSHSCDNPLCQNVMHLHPSSVAANTRAWATRRHNLSSHLADIRGVRGWTRELRDGLRDGRQLSELLAAGEHSQMELPLWDSTQ